LHLHDLSGQADPQTAAEAWMRADLRRPLDLSAGALFTEALFKIGPGLFLWYQGGHHILWDGFSAQLIITRVAEVYPSRWASPAR
jgi:nonribosomal peptide synthetase DhbF